MKLSYRDKVIFVAAIVVIILVAGFFLIIQPNMDKANVAKNNLAAKETEKAEVEAKLNTMPALVEQIHNLAKDIEEAQKNYFEPLEPYEYEQIIAETLKTCGVDVKSITTQYVVADDMIEYITPDETIYSYSMMLNADLYNELPQEIRDNFNGIGTPNPSAQMLGITNVTIQYGLKKGDFDMKDIWKYIDTISDDERTMKILSVSTPARYTPEPGEAASSEIETHQIVMQLYSIFPMNTEKVMEENGEVEIVTTPVETAE